MGAKIILTVSVIVSGLASIFLRDGVQLIAVGVFVLCLVMGAVVGQYSYRNEQRQLILNQAKQQQENSPTPWGDFRDLLTIRRYGVYCREDCDHYELLPRHGAAGAMGCAEIMMCMHWGARLTHNCEHQRLWPIRCEQCRRWELRAETRRAVGPRSSIDGLDAPVRIPARAEA